MPPATKNNRPVRHGRGAAALPLFARRLCAELVRLKACRAGENVVVAVSGGADSVALLAAMQILADRLKIRVHAAHFNHKLRGADSDADEAFVRRLARGWRIPFHCRKGNVSALAQRRKISLEMAARRARYAFLAETARRTGSAVVLTAHTADDQAETALLRFARGAGMRGLAGIPPISRVGRCLIARPMLGVWRREVEAFLCERGLKWREDKSNRSPFALRNRVRHEIMPLLESRLNPAARRAIARACEILREEDEWLDAAAAEMLAACRRSASAMGNKKHAISNRPLKSAPAAAWRRVLRLWLIEAGAAAETLEFESVERLRKLWRSPKKHACLCLPWGGTAEKQNELLVFYRQANGPAEPPRYRYKIPVPGETVIPEYDCVVKTFLAPEIRRSLSGRPGELPAGATISKAMLGRKVLIARSWRAGDCFRPFGMKGSRKLQDIFSDAKTQRSLRPLIPVIECGGKIVWVPGCRIAAEWAVRPGERTAVQIRIEPLKKRRSRPAAPVSDKAKARS